VEFGRVHGRAVEDSACADNQIRIVVVLETRNTVRTARDECVPRIAQLEPSQVLPWHADQYTQETIGVELASEGWEAISQVAGSDDRGSVDPATVTYVVRRV
jgi:hypothetical protein